MNRYPIIYIISAASMLSSVVAFAQAPPANKPVGNSNVPAAYKVDATPPAYPAGIKVNYIRIREALGPNLDEASFNTTDYTGVKETTQYFDGLGRPVQTVSRQASAGSAPRDVVIPQIYDQFGREVYKYLPYISTASDGKFKVDPFNEQKTFLQNQYPGEQVYYGKTIFENSPLVRIEKTFAPGNSWAGSETSLSENQCNKNIYSIIPVTMCVFGLLHITPSHTLIAT